MDEGAITTIITLAADGTAIVALRNQYNEIEMRSREAIRGVIQKLQDVLFSGLLPADPEPKPAPPERGVGRALGDFDSFPSIADFDVVNGKMRAGL